MIIGGAKPQAGAAGGDGLIQEGNDHTFRQVVLEESLKQPVLVDFWAPWCGPCRTLTPMIEKAVRAAGGKVKLVKINIDESPAYAGQLRVQSIPAVFAFDKGRPVDGFMGAIPESQIKAFIYRLAGEPDGAGAEELIASAEESLALGDIGGAAQSFAEAVQIDPENPKAIAGLARCYLSVGDIERAREVLALAPPAAANDPAIAGVRAQIEYAEAAEEAGDTRELSARIASNPDDHEARLELAKALAAKGDLAGAVDALIDSIARDREWNEQAARKELLKVFEAAGPMSDVARSGRRKLSAIWLS